LGRGEGFNKPTNRSTKENIVNGGLKILITT
jgi:hypothetical protein